MSKPCKFSRLDGVISIRPPKAWVGVSHTKANLRGNLGFQKAIESSTMKITSLHAHTLIQSCKNLSCNMLNAACHDNAP